MSTFNLEDVNLDKSEIRGVIERYNTDLRSFQRTLPPASSPKRDEAWSAISPTSGSAQLAKLDFYALSQDGQVDYILFKNYLDHDIRSIDLRIKDRAEAAPLRPVRPDDPRPRRVEARAEVAGMAEGRRDLDRPDQGDRRGHARRSSRSLAPRLRVKKSVANRALANVEGLRSTLRDWNGFYDGYDPTFAWWNGEPYKADRYRPPRLRDPAPRPDWRGGSRRR